MADQASLFGSGNTPSAQKNNPLSITTGEPLAARMRPRTLDDIVGHEHILGPGRFLRRSIEADTITSMILWGPPGSGKTSLAEVIALQTHAHFVSLSAVSAGVADLRKVVEDARRLRQFSQQRTILFIDEIHRFNKAQQDAVLPHVEHGVVTLIGATTENPSFEVNSALLSRSRVFVLRALTEDDVRVIVRRALADERGLAGKAQVSREAEDALVAVSNGDARVALNALELASDATAGAREITLADVREALQRRSLLYDRAGDQHYDTISPL